MPDYSNDLARLAASHGASSSDVDGVKYDGDVLTNSSDHTEIEETARWLDGTASSSALRTPPSMTGAAANAAQARLTRTRLDLQHTIDNLLTISAAAEEAAPTIATGLSSDPDVKSALERSSAAYRSVSGATVDVDAVTPNPHSDPEAGPGDGKKPDAAPESATPPPTATGKPADVTDTSPGTSPETKVSADAPASTASSSPQQSAPVSPTAAPVSSPAIAAPVQAQPAASAPVGGMSPTMGTSPAVSPTARTAGVTPGELKRMIDEEQARAADSGKASTSSGIKPERGHSPTSKRADDESNDSDGGTTVAAAAIPVTHPTVVGGPVDPSQTSGRTTSTSMAPIPGTGNEPKPTTPMRPGMVGGMGGMGGGMGGMGHGAQGAAASAGQSSGTAFRRDKESDKVLTGEAATDHALISHILSDDDDFTDGADTDDGDTDELLPDHRPPPTAEREIRDDEPW